MSRQRSRDTGPELDLRRCLHRCGARFRVHYLVPGRARRSKDIAFPRQRLAVFIDGCFWRSCPEHGSVPASNSGWWTPKLEGNKSRDVGTDNHLRALDWTVIRLWEYISVGEMVSVVLGARANLQDEQGNR
ncbi:MULTISPECIES: very short patch repair endonuclease [unclassified Novosphingobium]|nr:DNA mismatch endonuclease (patch repair protein) [Novosphingobium sp. BK256]MBB3376408.1 DNA mismatch endonuclease (patch repair protein) [Novosphingobium sp. BK280]MBB3380876.1 DNA mismatch endonuclease (patch repair protein) [Novosphingobium sp. BK258]MBB3422472.1 DNA mismatch endonuclease (patch repair protein) [Novosphingobium sp. BK267]MBB3451227.1 DNA mismatch endonuclease (patch repair protein) [Novosphingobium sp. BK352]MBB3479735.1 DNA mismatch endonuclease (patch repair protein) [